MAGRELAGRELAKQKTFHSAAARNPASDETRRKHARVVEHEQITGAQMPLQMAKRGVLDVAGISREHEQPRPSMLGGRPLGDQLVRQVEVEIAGSQ